MSNKPIVLLDVDSTLTAPRQPIKRAMVDILKRCIPFWVVAGSNLSLLEAQFFTPLYDYGFRGKFEAFICNGTIRYRCDYSHEKLMELVSEFNIREYLGNDSYRFLMDVLNKTLEIEEYKISSPLRIIGEQLKDRVSMINLCPIGRVTEENEDVQLNRKRFVNFDSENGYRHSVMNYLEKELSQLISEKNLEIILGGQTSFDVGIKDQDKSNAIRAVLQEEDYDRIVFIGDALFEGGNDSTIRRFIENWPNRKTCPVEAIQTESWEDTIDILHELNFVSKPD